MIILKILIFYLRLPLPDEDARVWQKTGCWSRSHISCQIVWRPQWYKWHLCRCVSVHCCLWICLLIFNLKSLSVSLFVCFLYAVLTIKLVWTLLTLFWCLLKRTLVICLRLSWIGKERERPGVQFGKALGKVSCPGIPTWINQCYKWGVSVWKPEKHKKSRLRLSYQHVVHDNKFLSLLCLSGLHFASKTCQK